MRSLSRFLARLQKAPHHRALSDSTHHKQKRDFIKRIRRCCYSHTVEHLLMEVTKFPRLVCKACSFVDRVLFISMSSRSIVNQSSRALQSRPVSESVQVMGISARPLLGAMYALAFARTTSAHPLARSSSSASMMVRPRSLADS